MLLAVKRLPSDGFLSRLLWPFAGRKRVESDLLRLFFDSFLICWFSDVCEIVKLSPVFSPKDCLLPKRL